MTKSKRWAFFIAVFGQVLWCAPVAAIFGYKWLARDEPNVVSACKGSGSRCYSGETANIMLASVFGAIAVIAAGITIVIVIRWRRASRPSSQPWPSALQRIQELEPLRATGVISDAEYDQKRKQFVIAEL